MNEQAMNIARPLRVPMLSLPLRTNESHMGKLRAVYQNIQMSPKCRGQREYNYYLSKVVLRRMTWLHVKSCL